MADYNVNMKQWNGTSFDNVLPLAYNAKQLGGQSLAEVKQWVQDNGLLLYSGQYTGTGTYGKNNPTSVTFPFEPVLFFFPSEFKTFFANALSTNYKNINVGSGTYIYIRKSADGKTISWYATESEGRQYNVAGETYYYVAIGGYDMGGQTEWTITQSGTWTVPRTGRYMLELYGGGGLPARSSGYQGGSSCQHYDSISLTAGQRISVTVGAAGEVPMIGDITSGGNTTFGSYTVAHGGNGTSSAGGAASGNLGTAGAYFSGKTNNYGKGVLSQKYGYGVNMMPKDNFVKGSAGAVYLEYLGA